MTGRVIVLDTERYFDERNRPAVGPTLEIVNADGNGAEVRVSWSRLRHCGTSRTAEFRLSSSELRAMLEQVEARADRDPGQRAGSAGSTVSAGSGRIVRMSDDEQEVRLTAVTMEQMRRTWLRLHAQEFRPLTSDDVQWVVNDIGELGVRIGDLFVFLYKGEGLQYKSGLHDDGITPMKFRCISAAAR